MLPKFLEIAFTLVLVVLVPALSVATVRRQDLVAVPRLALYKSAVLSEWILAAAGVLVMGLSHQHLRVAGFRTMPLGTFAAWSATIALVALSGLGLVLVAEGRGWWPAESELVNLLMPSTRREKIWAVLLVAPTAGITEEFLYRGFLLSTLAPWLHSVGWAVVVSSIVFGFAHTYQGANGMIRVMLLGALLAWPAVVLGSLYPSVAAHILIDAVALAWLGPRFLPSSPPRDASRDSAV